MHPFHFHQPASCTYCVVSPRRKSVVGVSLSLSLSLCKILEGEGNKNREFYCLKKTQVSVVTGSLSSWHCCWAGTWAPTSGSGFWNLQIKRTSGWGFGNIDCQRKVQITKGICGYMKQLVDYDNVIWLGFRFSSNCSCDSNSIMWHLWELWSWIKHLSL